MENYQNIKDLFAKYLDNNISRDEYDALLHFFGKKEDNGELHQLVTEAMSHDITEQDHERLGRAVDAVALKLREKLQPKKTILLRKYLPYAATVLLFFTAGIAYYIISSNKSQKEEQFVAVSDVSPGHNGATLTLANGKKILLDDVSAGSIVSEQGIEVSKTKDGQVVYTIKQSKTTADEKPNTLSTANGETYQIVLSDGTKVWLNAATTVQYSANLKARGTRNVKLLAGEAYFEVSKDKNHPFIVETPSQKVEVLGTHFNINSYGDEGRIVTTLEEGSVKVSTSEHDATRNIILKPGQQSLAYNNNIQVREADLQSVLAWKDGKIYFRDASIQEVLKQVSRWYNIQVEYEGEPTKEVFNGGIKRTANLSSVLRILELSKVNFKLSRKNNATILKVTQTK